MENFKEGDRVFVNAMQLLDMIVVRLGIWQYK